MRRAALLFLLTFSMWAAPTIRLYLKDGEFHLVREFEVQKDRVKYYSVERGDWEEIPLDLVDVKRTKAEQDRNAETLRKEEASDREERQAEREARKEIESIPQDPGVFWINNDKVGPLKVGEVNFVVDKKRSILKALSPLPLVSGKAVLEMDGESSAFVIQEERPEFYFRLAREERLAIIKLLPGTGKNKTKTRIVEKIQILPVVNELAEELTEVESFRRQVGDLLFKIWPTKPLEPGEYALIEYSPAVEGKYSLQVWDFSIRPK